MREPVRLAVASDPRRFNRDVVLWLAFAAYALILAFVSLNHELCSDELHSWNIAKASGSLSDLIGNLKYEGHPPLWYVLLWGISKLSHSLTYLHALQFIIALAAAALVIFWSPFPILSRVLIIFGYYFLFEYGVFCRNYALGVLLAFAICVLRDRTVGWRSAIYYPLLFLLANVHLLACLLAASLHASLLFERWRSKSATKRVILWHGILGASIPAAALYFIFPPSDSELSLSFWLDRWTIRRLLVFIVAPLRALVPIPAWWEYHFWNTQALLELHQAHGWVRGVSYASAVSVFGAIVFVLNGSKKGLVLWVTNAVLTLLVVLIFPMTSARYVGFIFIAFLASCWLSYRDRAYTKAQACVLCLVLIVQVVAGAFAAQRDIRFPFSRSAKIAELVGAAPLHANIVADNSCMENLLSYLDRPFYSVHLGKEVFLLKWNGVSAKTDSSADGIRSFFERNEAEAVFMCSSKTPQDLAEADAVLYQSFKVSMIANYNGAIDKGGDVYLYRIGRADRIQVK
jgi:hypothetical protein